MPYVRIEYPTECPYRDLDFRCQKDCTIFCPENFFPNNCPLDIVDDSEIEE